MIKVLIFDLGGVCFEIDWSKINEEMIETFGVNMLIKSSGDERIIQYYYEVLEGKRDVKDFFSKLSGKKNVYKIMNFYKKLYKKNKNFNDKIIKLVRKLKEKLIVVCLTDTNKIHFRTHKEQSILKNFHYVFTSFKLGSKPSVKYTNL